MAAGGVRTVPRSAGMIATEVAAEPVATPLDYWRLLKPNVMQLVVFTGAVGLYLAPGTIHPLLGFVAVLAIALGAGACAAINNAYDADIDRQMRRTRGRPTATGRIAPAEALGTGIALALIAVMLMGLALNWLAAGLLAFTILFYLVVYTLFLKRRTPQNIVIGGVAGALPPVVGWAAVTGDVGLPPLLLFLIVFLWTPPHFWSLALYRNEDYRRAGVPMLPVVAGRRRTLRYIFAYALAVSLAGLLPVAVGAAGALYGLVALVAGAMFTGVAWRLLRTGRDEVARRGFRVSVLYLFLIFLGLVVDHAVFDAFGS